jgi:antitoxin component of MazEF toxin-antitoxin module
VPKDPDEVQWQGDEMGRFVFGERHNEVRPGRKVSNLKQLVAKITPENRHGETDWGADVGKEIIE